MAEHNWSEPIVVGGKKVAPGERQTIDLPVANLYTHAGITMPVHVARGKRKGPCLVVSAALHGDEINGVEVIRRLLKLPLLKSLRGTLIAVPIVNVHGFLHLSRYLPDRRDLNRNFPGSERGSIAARLAHQYCKEVLSKADVGIDLHTAAVHRANLPQVRGDLANDRVRELAEAFGVPLLVNSNLVPGSLREYAFQQGIPMLLYEAGEALRFEEVSIRAGLRGVLRVMAELKMLPKSKTPKRPKKQPLVASDSSWLRAPNSGILRTNTALGDYVKKGEGLGFVADPFGESETELEAPFTGVIIGRTNLPLLHEGDAIFHVARVRGVKDAAERFEVFSSEYEGPGLLPDEPPIV